MLTHEAMRGAGAIRWRSLTNWQNKSRHRIARIGTNSGCAAAGRRPVRCRSAVVFSPQRRCPSAQEPTSSPIDKNRALAAYHHYDGACSIKQSRRLRTLDWVWRNITRLHPGRIPWSSCPQIICPMKLRAKLTGKPRKTDGSSSPCSVEQQLL
jgi:hypothetical protein